MRKKVVSKKKRVREKIVREQKQIEHFKTHTTRHMASRTFAATPLLTMAKLLESCGVVADFPKKKLEYPPPVPKPPLSYSIERGAPGTGGGGQPAPTAPTQAPGTSRHPMEIYYP